MKKILIVVGIISVGFTSCSQCDSVVCSMCYEELGDCASEPAHKEFCPNRESETY